MKIERIIISDYCNHYKIERTFIDILDEMAITKNERYGVTDIKPWEVAIYKKKVGEQ